jgi:hypothetical protein
VYVNSGTIESSITIFEEITETCVRQASVVLWFRSASPNTASPIPTLPNPASPTSAWDVIQCNGVIGEVGLGKKGLGETGGHQLYCDILLT